MNNGATIELPDPARDNPHNPHNIPEPTTYALFLVTIALFFLVRWRKQFNPRNVPIKEIDLFDTK